MRLLRKISGSVTGNAILTLLFFLLYYLYLWLVYEEAMLLYRYNTKKKIEVPGREISRESQERFGGFTMVYTGRYKANKMAAFNELAKDYGDSYFFYYIYGPAGLKK